MFDMYKVTKEELHTLPTRFIADSSYYDSLLFFGNALIGIRHDMAIEIASTHTNASFNFKNMQHNRFVKDMRACYIERLHAFNLWSDNHHFKVSGHITTLTITLIPKE